MTDKAVADLTIICLIVASVGLFSLLRFLETIRYNRLEAKPPVYRIYSIERLDGTLAWFADKLTTNGWCGRLCWTRKLENAASFLHGPWESREAAGNAIIADFKYRQRRFTDKKTNESTFTLSYKDGHPVVVEL